LGRTDVKETSSMVTLDPTRTPDPERSSKLEALVRLLDDASPVVRDAVTFEFASYGPGLGEDLRRLKNRPDEAGWKLLGRITGVQYRRRIALAWPHWPHIVDDRIRLERALTILAEFQNGPRWHPPLGESLDRLAEEYLGCEGEKSPDDLARFLFHENGMQCAKNGMLQSEFSNLAHVIESGMGLPVSLVCIYLMVGRRAGLDIHACNWPRHFLARYRDESGMFIVDPANHGAVVDAETFLSMQGTSRDAAEAVLSFEVDAATVVTRVLGNLVRAYRSEGDTDNYLFCMELLRDIESKTRAGALC